MVLVCNGVIQDSHPLTSYMFYDDHPEYVVSAVELLSEPVASVGPIGLLYVGQREFATVASFDPNFNLIGTDDTTTCVIGILRHSGSGAVALARFDDIDLTESVRCMIARVEDMSGSQDGRLELQLIGGYVDPEAYSEKIISNVFFAFQDHELLIHVTRVCIGRVNTTIDENFSCPNIYGVAVNIKTGNVFPAEFLNQGPDVELRAARMMFGLPQMYDIYDTSVGMLYIEPFFFDNADKPSTWIDQSDEELLIEFSTSPFVEPPHFVDQVRAALKFQLDHPNPEVTVFDNFQTRYYKHDKNTGTWRKLAS